LRVFFVHWDPDGLACSRQQISVPIWRLRDSRSRPWLSRATARQEGVHGAELDITAAVHTPVVELPSPSSSSDYVTPFLAAGQTG
jgi:hypothetical protein